MLNGVALLPLFAPWSGIPRPLYALFAGRKGMPAIARYFMDELTTRLANVCKFTEILQLPPDK
nr:hypothetical protein [Escherichia coli]